MNRWRRSLLSVRADRKQEIADNIRPETINQDDISSEIIGCRSGNFVGRTLVRMTFSEKR